MIAHITAVSDSYTIMEFAFEIFSGKTFPSSPDKTTVVQDLTEAAVEKCSFYQTDWKSHADPSFASSKDRVTTQSFAEQALIVGCTHLIERILQRVLDVYLSLDKEQANHYATELMLPFIPYLAQFSEITDAFPSNFATFQETTIRSVLGQLLARPTDKVLYGQLATLIDAALLNMGGRLLLKSYVLGPIFS